MNRKLNDECLPGSPWRGRGRGKHLRRIRMAPDTQRLADGSLGWLWNPGWRQEA